MLDFSTTLVSCRHSQLNQSPDQQLLIFWDGATYHRCSEQNTVKKILFLSANPKNTDKLRLEEEVREIEEGLKRSCYGDQFNLISKWAVRSRDFYRYMLDIQPQIVHFSGHGGGEHGIVLEDETAKVQFLQTNQLAGMFKLFAKNEVWHYYLQILVSKAFPTTPSCRYPCKNLHSGSKKPCSVWV